MNGPTPPIPMAHAARGPLTAADLDARIAEKRWDSPLPTPTEAEAQLLDMLRAVITPAGDADCDFCGLGDFSCANASPSCLILQPPMPAEACSEFQGDEHEPEWSGTVHGLEPWLLRHPTAATFALVVVLLALWGLAGWSDGAMLPGEGEAYADELAVAAGYPASEPRP